MSANEWIIKNMNLIRCVASKMADNHTQYEEFLSVAMIGSWRAIQDFNPDKNKSLSGWIGYRIRCAILNHINRFEKKCSAVDDLELPSKDYSFSLKWEALENNAKLLVDILLERKNSTVQGATKKMRREGLSEEAIEDALDEVLNMLETA